MNLTVKLILKFQMTMGWNEVDQESKTEEAEMIHRLQKMKIKMKMKHTNGEFQLYSLGLS